MSTQPVVLTHSAPLWNLPCHNPRCLETMLYLEMFDPALEYERRICSYNSNPFAPEIQLPLLRYKNRTLVGGGAKSIIDGFEGMGSSPGIVGKNNGLNCVLEPSQKADLSALTSLIREKLHLVTIHQIYADDKNWGKYCVDMSNYLPYIPRQYLLKKEREKYLRQLTAHQIITRKDAIDLLDDCLNVIYMKMAAIKNINGISNETGEYFFGNTMSSLDAVLVSELVILSCSRASLPNIYLDSINKDGKLRYLLNYVTKIMNKYRTRIEAKLKKDQYISPPILSPQMNDDSINDILDWNKQKSLLFLLGSCTALALYWKVFRPITIKKQT